MPVLAKTTTVLASPFEDKVIYHTPETAKPIIPTEPETEPGDIDVSFDEKTGTLTVSGTGKVTGLYSREANHFFEYKGIISIDNSVKHLIIEEGITEIENAFNDMHALQSVKLPRTLKEIYRAFVECKSLKSVKIPKETTNIGTCFYNCEQLKNVEFEGEITIFFAFEGSAIEEVYIPDNSKIDDAFNYCKKLTKVVLGKNVYVHHSDYVDCAADISFSFGSGNKKLVVYVPERLWHYYKTLPSGTLILLYNPVLNWCLIILCACVVLLVPLIIYLKRKRKCKEG